MDTVDVMLVVALVAVTVVCGVAVWALREAVVSLRSVRQTSDDVRERAVPLLDKLDVTVDAVNVEILRIDAIITSLEDATERVSTASGTISGIVNVPGEVLHDVLERLRRGRKERREEASAGTVGAEADTDTDTVDSAPQDEGATPAS